MHRGVQALISWISVNADNPKLSLQGPATVAELNEVEDALVSPLPSDVRLLLSRCNGGQLPSGALLHAGGRGEGSMLGTLAQVAERLGRPANDPELPLPYFRTNDGPLLAFDRSAGPVADTWPIVDGSFDGELRLVHRTFDGWCRLCLLEWDAPDFDHPFSLEKYLRAGQRHVEIEPDVSAAHATVAHALRRSGEPERALASYLAAGRCVPPLAWCDWEALKLAVVLVDPSSAMEAARRLSLRAPASGWRARATSPAQVADLLGMMVHEIDSLDPLLRMLDQLGAQTADAEQARHIAEIRRAAWSRQALPPTRRARPTAAKPDADLTTWWTALENAYRKGTVRDDDVLLDPAYRPLRQHRPLADLLRIRREF
jgi:hypothetical protein